MTENVLRPCRICAEQFPQPKLLDLFGISSEIELLIGVPLIIGVDVPTSICTQCNAEFEAARDFKRKCIESNELFETKCESLVVPKIEHIPISPSGLSNASFFREDSELLQNEESDGTDDNDRDPDFTLPQEQNNCDNNDTKDTPITESKKHKSFENKSAKRVKKKKIEKTQNLMRRKQKERHPLVCDICGNIFKARHIFALHKRRHSNDKPYACELCPSKFFTNSELKRHMRRHTGEKPYECQYCHRKFSDYGTHVKHERTHTNTRPFACQHCGKAFSCGFVLKNHMLTHTGERNYKCTICNKSFGRQHNLTTHEKSIYHQNNLLKKENSEKLD